ncbi:hypothetical protein [Planktothrix agardhii]|jgi:multidrug transporter EmrE-like cation transporter|uniref:hypothetical protein n=1 Tax=Planktothrix agardhii TaxID=1160 RepID=UPI001D0B6233|nr:hypothetical protein [Planktothrix agardhii]MCF3607638.1 hypothetical protein [Planktothrix agardhii 1033]MCB8751758.1 hypothetical protein [Planktothrix agardhii 1810]MCB8785821.1 hypothetical protein [Planktothrix agardhii 1025]MCF3612429.1 hypothetical protein [Planktothrix agardhii 1027]MCF3646307.1 hypothetical protein [Planktothrix agardhii 1026]
MNAFIKSDLESLKDEQLKNIFNNLNLININIFPTERQKMIDTIYIFLQNHTKSVKGLKKVDDQDIIDCWQGYITSLLQKTQEKDNNLKRKKNLILSEIYKIDTVPEISEQLAAIARSILLFVFQSLGEKEQEQLIKKIQEETSVKSHFKLTDEILNKAMIEAILGGATPVALGAALPIVAGLLFNYLSTGFLFTVVLPTILGVLGIKLAVFTGALTFISGPIGWGIAGGVGLVATLLAGSKFFKQRDEVLLIMTILSIYTCTYQNQMPTLPGN